jgi:hypothetical protein
MPPRARGISAGGAGQGLAGCRNLLALLHTHCKHGAEIRQKKIEEVVHGPISDRSRLAG